MKISSRAQEISESVTLKLNAQAMALAEDGKRIFNLTAGQLPFKPCSELVDLIRNETNFLKSYQYSPVPGLPQLKEKVMKHMESTRDISFKGVAKDDGGMACIVSNGAKHSLSIAMGALIEPGDEVIMFAPYWVSYPEMIKINGGIPKTVSSSIFNNFEPSLEDLKATISSKTKAIVLNSPTNPSGTHYRPEWMKGFAALMMEYPEVVIISDEIYYQLYYYDPKPTYFYQYEPSLLDRTVIIDGISKTLACTGLRIGFTVGPATLIKAMGKLQGQTASGANSLIQRSLLNFDFNKIDDFLGPIKDHLRGNAKILRDAFTEASLDRVWYQSVSAFYFLVDFSQCPVMDKFRKDPEDTRDYAVEICEHILNELGVAIVPSTDFGTPNSARISLVNEPEPFEEAIKILIKYLQGNE
jgi:aspartate aminotransferase